ncbi:hypothetical protein DXG01_003133 [Tephrocybe rancida]|nr:hypothetical protein DXG01_003133 [Tephrocybe rancida]
MTTSVQTFTADAVLFDMDGTLTDSISAVEAAWGKVAADIGQDPAHVIAATHGKRAIDNLAHFRPEINAHKMDDAVEKFEESILFFADAYNLHGPGSRTNSGTNTPSSGIATPSLSLSQSPDFSAPSSRAPSPLFDRRPSFATRLSDRMISHIHIQGESGLDDSDEVLERTLDAKTGKDTLDAWMLEASNVDRSVQILPGVKKLMDSIPAGKYAVATSGAKTYAHGCLTRVGITPPPVTITADDKRLKAGKPAPDPFLLAAKCLGYAASDCVVFEDSPSGIRAGVASGATVVALCTSHEREKIENCGAHYIVEDMESVQCAVEGGRLRFCVRV